jgi:hypothetical protein
MTFTELVDKYGLVKVKFTTYYKYMFTFKGQIDGLEVIVYVGGSSDDIYKFDVDADQEYEVRGLPFYGVEIWEGSKLIGEHTSGW